MIIPVYFRIVEIPEEKYSAARIFVANSPYQISYGFMIVDRRTSAYCSIKDVLIIFQPYFFILLESMEEQYWLLYLLLNLLSLFIHALL